MTTYAGVLRVQHHLQKRALSLQIGASRHALQLCTLPAHEDPQPARPHGGVDGACGLHTSQTCHRAGSVQARPLCVQQAAGVCVRGYLSVCLYRRVCLVGQDIEHVVYTLARHAMELGHGACGLHCVRGCACEAERVFV